MNADNFNRYMDAVLSLAEADVELALWHIVPPELRSKCHKAIRAGLRSTRRSVGREPPVEVDLTEMIHEIAARTLRPTEKPATDKAVDPKRKPATKGTKATKPATKSTSRHN